jgi:hypothetical protein
LDIFCIRYFFYEKLHQNYIKITSNYIKITSYNLIVIGSDI